MKHQHKAQQTLSTRLRRAGCLSAVAAAALYCASPVQAANVGERIFLYSSAGGDAMVGGTPSDNFSTGMSGVVRGGYRVVGPMSLQLGSSNYFMPAEQGDLGRMTTAEAGVRVAAADIERRGSGPVIDANGGIGQTGDLDRFTFNVGIGWDFRVGDALRVGPTVRYAHILQPNSEAAPDDARMVGLGFSGTFTFAPEVRERVVRVGAERAPEVDRDDDGIPDEQDSCPLRAEDFDSFEDKDGCPESDNDDDGIEDMNDRCPNKPELRNGYEDEDGCPDEAPPPAPVGGSTTVVLEAAEQLPTAVLFAYGSWKLLASQQKGIDKACEFAKANPEVRLRVVGHADERGDAPRNHLLSAERAAHISGFVVECGIAPERVTVAAHGWTQRLCKADSDECHAQNRRVVFEVLRPKKKDDE